MQSFRIISMNGIALKEEKISLVNNLAYALSKVDDSIFVNRKIQKCRQNQ
jgi:hypothetical protein